jgi:phosphatidylserine/phosphatidylglycerophosphate/cardiolipin synthase-like enzyme
MHCKLIIIDGKTVIVGSTNWSYYAIDKNREASVVIRDERIARIFEEYLFSISAS